MRKLKKRMIYEKIMIIGCIVFIAIYTAAIIGTFISPRIYFSNFWSSTVMIMLIGVILILTIENHNTHLIILTEMDDKV